MHGAALNGKVIAPKRRQSRLQSRRAIDDDKPGPFQSTRIKVVEELAPRRLAFSAHIPDRKQDLLAIPAHPYSRENRDVGGLAVQSGAMVADRTVQTPPYVYFESNDIGITVAARTRDGNGVVGGDLTLRTLSQMLGAKRATANSHTVVFDAKTSVLAASDIDHVLQVVRQDERPLVIQQTLASTEFAPYRALSRLNASGQREGVHEVEADGKKWVVWISPLDLGGDRSATMGIVAPSDEVFAGSECASASGSPRSVLASAS